MIEHQLNKIKEAGYVVLDFPFYLDPPVMKVINLGLGKTKRRREPSVTAIYPDAFLHHHSIRRHQRSPKSGRHSYYEWISKWSLCW
jgi:hypothetical protein